MFCEECGTKNENGTKFCSNCGKEMNKTVKAEKTPVVQSDNTERKVDFNAAADNVTAKGKEIAEKAKEFYNKDPKKVYIICGAVVVAIILLVVLFGGKKMICEADDDYSETIVEAKYNGDDDITYLEIKSIMDYTDKDFEDMLDMLGYDDIDEYIEEMEEEAEDTIKDADVEGLEMTVKKSGDNIVSTMTFKGEALEEYLDDQDIKDIDDLEDDLEDGYEEYKCEK